MSLLRTVLSRACSQYSCLVAPKNTGILSVGKAWFSDRTKKEKREFQDKMMQFDKAGQDISTPTPIQLQAERIRPNDLRPGYGNVPIADIYDQTFDGVRYDHLPTVHITCTRNNTKGYATNGPNGEFVVCQKSGGTVGFENAKKSSNVAAQAVGVAIGQILVKKKMTNVRVTMDGTGVHRMTALRGLLLGGVNIVSISDRTYPSFNNRPRKPRRV